MPRGHFAAGGCPGWPLFAVLGAGNGGQAMAAHLASQGWDVVLYNRSPGRLRELLEHGALEVSGTVDARVPVRAYAQGGWGHSEPDGEPGRVRGGGGPGAVNVAGDRPGRERGPGRLESSRAAGAGAVSGGGGRAGTVWVTGSLGEAARARVLMVTVPATGHADLGHGLAPHVREDQVLVLNPGRTLGALDMERALRAGGCRELPVVAEAQSLLYAARVVGLGHVHIFSIKQRVPLAALPAWQTPRVLALLREAFPQFVAAETVLHTSLDNIGAIFHPAPVLLNLARVEGGEPFDHYHQGITPAVARVLEALDGERLSVAAALGIGLPTAREWLREAYGVDGPDLHRALQENRAYRGIRAPTDLDTRYLWEDVPTGLVPLASLGELAGVPTPTMRSLIHLASLVHGVDYFRHGRTLGRMGLGGLAVADLLDYVRERREAA
ncbi:MAG: NAD/NADP octopine/nopaline dehydrogenase family protein [Firmicutes bacterium]|nr:NAD/NADP octopine/nopaline dehydrogenase family protein [Bacillota bacterium]